MANRDALFFPQADREWLEAYLPERDHVTRGAKDKPFVTLTFATSLDAALAISPGVQTALSGPQSKAMTHFLRSRHDAILVGVGTAVADNPSLNCRLDGSGGYGGVGLDGQPQPVVIDPRNRWAFDKSSKVLQLAAAGRGKAPWVVTCAAPPVARAQLLQEVGGSFIILDESGDSDSGGTVSWGSIFTELANRGVRSVMVEGGAHVLNTLLSPGEIDAVSSIIVTIAPVWLGPDGIKVSPQRTLAAERGTLPVARLTNALWHQLGDDVVLCGHP
ncbi:hypothetical protein CAC42_2769 [Sphaceloma murrayae]|uniref:2,5-diamino-6-ribosylamino-4(3H)-pyrimidinone 5'-phosphate reductase n=1 Tax=Sphaceloma murrayae TaxID=2082308 RepID=A0A2K1R0L6_9PEZI|nr:hypothetical protein CAC42_2769 [Sphaceloma murrayae]